MKEGMDWNTYNIWTFGNWSNKPGGMTSKLLWFTSLKSKKQEVMHINNTSLHWLVIFFYFYLPV